MKLTANDLLKMKIVDEVIKEPIGGAHRNKEEILNSTKYTIKKYLEEFSNKNSEEIYNARKQKFLNIGTEKPLRVFPTKTSWIKRYNLFLSIKQAVSKSKLILMIIIAFLVGIFLYYFNFL